MVYPYSIGNIPDTAKSEKPTMAGVCIKDQEANMVAEQLARARGLTKTAAVKLALRRELDRDVAATAPADRPLRERMVDFWERHPLPNELGPVPGKPFYDDVSGGL